MIFELGVIDLGGTAIRLTIFSNFEDWNVN